MRPRRTEKLTTEQKASELSRIWRENPKIFFRDVLTIDKIWKLQNDLIEACPHAVNEHKHIYVGSGHALGKDYITSALSLWFLYSYQPSIVIQTAPTDRQVRKIMYGETLGHFNRMKEKLGGEAYANPYIEIKKENWFLLGFTTKETGASKRAQGGKFQGFHAPSMCVIVSEAQAVEDDIYDQIDAITTSENVLVIFIGNPTRASGRFAKGLKDRERNIVFNFSCLDNPNYIHRETIIPGLASYNWVENKREKWGEEDPRWYGRVLGLIPKTSINNVFSESVTDAASARTHTTDDVDNSGVSIDCAGEGDDSDVIMSGSGGRVLNTIEKSGMSPGEKAIQAAQFIKAIDGKFVVVDCDGLGIGTFQELSRLKLEDITLLKFHGSGGSTKKKLKVDDYEFENLRAEAWFEAMERAKDGRASIPNDEELIEELLEVKFFENKRGKIQLEDKDDVKERLGRSPDKADAWVMLQWAFSQKCYKPIKQMSRSEEFWDRVKRDIKPQSEKEWRIVA